MIIKKMCFPTRKNCYHFPTEIENCWVQDIENENIHYVIGNSADGNGGYNYQFIHIINQVDNEVITQNLPNITANSYSNCYSFDIIYQDTQYLYLMIYTNGAGYNDFQYSYNYIYQFNKKTKSFDSIIRLDNTSKCKNLGINKFGLLEIMYLDNSGNTYYEYINLVTKKSESKKYIGGKKVNHQINPSDIDEKTNKVYFPYISNENNERNLVTIKCFDRNSKEFKDMYITSNNYLATINDKGCYTLHCKTFWKDTKQYLILGITLSPYYSDIKDPTYLEPIKFYLFEVKSETELIFKSIFNDENIPYTTILFIKDKNILICGSNYYFDVAKINDETNFEKTNTSYNHYGYNMLFGLSENGKIYLQSYDTSIEELSIGIGKNLYVELDKEIYNYQGNDIEGTVNVGVKDIMGNYIGCNVKLELYGNLTFQDNTKLKEIKMSKDGLLTIPIIIKGEGKVTVLGDII